MTSPIQLSPLSVFIILAVVLLPGGLLLSPLLMRGRRFGRRSLNRMPARQGGAITIDDNTPRARRANARIRAISAPLSY